MSAPTLNALQVKTHRFRSLLMQMHQQLSPYRLQLIKLLRHFQLIIMLRLSLLRFDSVLKHKLAARPFKMLPFSLKSVLLTVQLALMVDRFKSQAPLNAHPHAHSAKSQVLMVSSVSHALLHVFNAQAHQQTAPNVERSPAYNTSSTTQLQLTQRLEVFA